MRISALFSLACAIVAFILGLLALLAGYRPGFMEDYDIIRFNTSGLGQNLVSTSTSASPAASATSVGSFLSGLAHNVSSTVVGEIEDGLNDVAGAVANKLSSELGLAQWYSLHLLDLCEGTYKPNATAKHAHENITNCTKAHAMHHVNLTKTLQDELSIGKYHLDLSDIAWPSSINKGIHDLNIAINATFVLYVIAVSLSCLLILTSLLAFLLSGARLLSFLNWGIATLAFLAFLIASIVVTILQSKANHIVNKYGNEIGLYAEKGIKFLAMTWAATGVMGLALLAWVVEFCVGKRQKGREYREKKSGGGLFGRRKGSPEVEYARSVRSDGR